MTDLYGSRLRKPAIDSVLRGSVAVVVSFCAVLVAGCQKNEGTVSADPGPNDVEVTSKAPPPETVPVVDLGSVEETDDPGDPVEPAEDTTATEYRGSELTDLALELEGSVLAWLSDGETVVIGAGRRGGIYRVSLSAPSERVRIASDGKDPAVSPTNDDDIVFVRGSSRSEQIWQVKSTGLTKLADGGRARWSTDGETIFFRDNRYQMQSMKPAVPSQPTSIDPHDVLKGHFFPTTSPNGKFLAQRIYQRFVVHDLESGKELVSIPWSPRGCLANWSHDSRYVACGSYGFGDGVDFGVMLVDVEEKRSIKLLSGDHTAPSFSPDHRRLAVDLRTSKVPFTIRVFNLPDSLADLWDNAALVEE